MQPHSLTLTLVGGPAVGRLFGQRRLQPGANGYAALAMTNTFIATAAGFSWAMTGG